MLVNLGSTARHPAPSWALIDCGPYASVASQGRPDCGALPCFAAHPQGHFSLLWAIRGSI